MHKIKIPPKNTDSSLKILKATFKDHYTYEGQMIQKYGDIYRFKLFNKTCYSISHPDHMKHVLLDNMQNYIRPREGSFSQKAFIEYCGNPNNLRHTTDQQYWKKSGDAVIPPFFSKERFQGYCSAIAESVLKMTAKWETNIKAGEPVNIKEEMLKLGSRAIMENLFDLKDFDFDRFYMEKTRVFAQIGKRGVLPSFLHWLLPSQDKKDWQEGNTYLHHFTESIINQRIGRQNTHKDIICCLIEAFKDAPNKEQMLANFNSEFRMYLVTGETLGAGLNHALAILSGHSSVEDKVHDELARVLKGNIPEYDSLNTLSYLGCFIKEALRFCTPAPLLTRITLKDDEISGYHVPKDTLIFLRHYWNHRHPDFWDNPERFIPERFKDKPWGQDHEYAYTPFSGGPRACIGGRFGMHFYTVVLATLLQKYRFKLLPGASAVPEGVAISFPKDADRMIVLRRG
ncbi:MAG: cytochrome P450 [Proteobacteria bacterium]|nr:cytochrome P450 [Pseudomonadota bacterium]